MPLKKPYLVPICTSSSYIRLLKFLAVNYIDGEALYSALNLDINNMSRFVTFKFNSHTYRAVKNIYLNYLKKIPLLDVIHDLKDLDKCQKSIKYYYKKTPKTDLNNSIQNYITVARLLTTFVADERFDEIHLQNVYAPDGVAYTSFVNYLGIPDDFWTKLPIDDNTRLVNGLHISSLWIYATHTLPPRCYIPHTLEQFDECNVFQKFAIGPFSVRLPRIVTDDFYQFIL
jgi:hypothetical protein